MLAWVITLFFVSFFIVRSTLSRPTVVIVTKEKDFIEEETGP